MNVIDISINETDKWYKNLRSKISKSPCSFPQWKVENDLLYKYVPSNIPFDNNERLWKLVVPKSQRNDIIYSCHDAPINGHFGHFKTLSKVKEIYYWPKMSYDVLKYIKRCQVCGEQKMPNIARMGVMGKEKTASFPFQIISVDLMGPFPRSTKGNKYLFVISDWFTKYVLSCPLRDAKIPSMIKFMENNVFLTFGVPQIVYCDNGTQFCGNVFKKFIQGYNVKLWFTPKYSPQCNYVERSNQTVGRLIRNYIKDNHKLWDKEIPKLNHAINCAKHEITGFSPVFLNFGRFVPVSGKYYGELDSVKGSTLGQGNRDQYASNLLELPAIYKNVQDKLHKAYVRNASNYNLRKRDISFNVGDRVWRRNKILSDASRNFSSKLAPKYVLCKVQDKLSKLVYRLTNSDGADIGNWHIKDLKPYFGSNSDISTS